MPGGPTVRREISACDLTSAISALVFGIAHISLGELPALFVLGLGLGCLRLQSGRLGPSVLMHGLWNGLTFANLLLFAG